MAYNGTCGNPRIKNVTSLDWCYNLRPPPIPAHLKAQLEPIYQNDKGYQLYKKFCNFDEPSASTTPTSSAGGTIAVVVILVILILIGLAIGIWWYLFRYKKRSSSINSLPLKEYANTNYLDNRARQNQCYNGSTTYPDQQISTPSNGGNQYGSFPADGNGSVGYRNPRNRKSLEANVEPPVEFDGMNTRVNSTSSRKSLPRGSSAYDNDSFMTNSETRDSKYPELKSDGFVNQIVEPEARSPSANSQTPLFDEMDGPALPNLVPSNQMLSDNSLNSIDKSKQNEMKLQPLNRLPPIDIGIIKNGIPNSTSQNDQKTQSLRKISDTDSPKKKKPIYLRKSSPVDGIEDIGQDMSGNRKSV